MKQTLPILLLFTLAFCSPQPSEQSVQAQPALGLEDLGLLMDEFQQHPSLKHAMLGAYVMDLDSGAVWLDYHSQWGMATGSTMKAITTATALASLGAEFRFQTRLGYKGEVKQGVLRGDLFIIGGGDPTLGIDDLNGLWERWAKALRRKGIQKIEGDIIGEASYFAPYLLPRTWIWEDLGNYYGAGACALNIHENYYSLDLETASPGQPTRILGLRPEVPELVFQNELLSGPSGSGDKGYIFGAPFTYNRVLRGTIPPNRSRFTLKGSLPDPALQAAQWLRAYLKERNIASRGAKGDYRTAPKLAELTFIDTVYSPELIEIVEKTNTRSVNTYAEALLKMMGKQLEGKGDTETGAKAVVEFWKKQGLGMEGFVMEDGSGLSRFNAITPKQMAEVLAQCTLAPWYKEFKGSLAVAGKTGTLRGMCRNSGARGRIFAKSGYINGVRCYTGYANTLKGKPLAFAIMVNNFTGEYKTLTPLFERFFDTLVRTEQ